MATGDLYIDSISASTSVTDYSDVDIKPSGKVFGKCAKIILGDGSNNINDTNYVDAMTLGFSDFAGLTVSDSQINIDPDFAGLYQCCFQVAVNGGNARANVGFQWDIDGSIQPEMYLSNYNRNDIAIQGGTHDTSSDGGCQIFDVTSTIRLRGSRQGNGGTVTTVQGSLTIILIAPAV